MTLDAGPTADREQICPTTDNLCTMNTIHDIMYLWATSLCLDAVLTVVPFFFTTVFIYHGNASDVAEEAALQQDEDASCLNDMRTIVQLDE